MPEHTIESRSSRLNVHLQHKLDDGNALGQTRTSATLSLSSKVANSLTLLSTSPIHSTLVGFQQQVLSTHLILGGIALGLNHKEVRQLGQGSSLPGLLPPMCWL